MDRRPRARPVHHVRVTAERARFPLHRVAMMPMLAAVGRGPEPPEPAATE